RRSSRDVTSTFRSSSSRANSGKRSVRPSAEPDLVSQISQRPRNPVITPVTVLLGNANDQLLDLSLDARPARPATGLGPIEFAGDQLAVPGQDGVGPRHIGHFAENLAAQPDRSRRAWLARRLRASIVLSTGPSGCDFRRPDIRSAPTAPGPSSL